MSSFLTLPLHVIPNSLLRNLWWAASNFFICVTDSGHDSAPYNRVEMTSDSLKPDFHHEADILAFADVY